MLRILTVFHKSLIKYDKYETFYDFQNSLFHAYFVCLAETERNFKMMGILPEEAPLHCCLQYKFGPSHKEGTMLPLEQILFYKL